MRDIGGSVCWWLWVGIGRGERVGGIRGTLCSAVAAGAGSDVGDAGGFDGYDSLVG